MIRNTLRSPSMDYNLIEPFIMRDDGDIINDAPKIYCEDSIVDDHSISFDQSYLQIPLQLNGVFSYFHTRVLTETEPCECEKLFLTPDSSEWNLHCQSYERNEQSMLNFEDNMSEPSRIPRHQVVFEDQT